MPTTRQKDNDEISRVSCNKERCHFVVHRPTPMLNALRRSLLEDVENIAPKSVTITTNTTCQNDEYIAHRLSMIPFEKKVDDEDAEGSLSVEDKTAWASELCGNIVPLVDVPIMKMRKGQQLDLSIEFTKGRGADHVKFSRIGAVSYKVTETSGQIGFETMPTMSSYKYLLAAINSLIKRLDDARYFVETEYDSSAKRVF